MTLADFGDGLNWLESGFIADGRSDSLVQAVAGLTGKAGHFHPLFLGGDENG